jgi:hypothetical protein
MAHGPVLDGNDENDSGDDGKGAGNAASPGSAKGGPGNSPAQANVASAAKNRNPYQKALAAQPHETPKTVPVKETTPASKENEKKAESPAPVAKENKKKTETPAPVVKGEKEKAASVPAAEERRVLLQTVGLLAASQVYQAYLNIGLLADGKASGAYQAKDCQGAMEIVFHLLEAADLQLEKISKMDLSQEDQEGVTSVRKLSGLVRQQGDELLEFWNTSNQENLARYAQCRQQAWQGLNGLLKLDKK